MKTLAFGVTYWCDCEKQYPQTSFKLQQHFNRILKYTNCFDFFYAPGAYSDPNICPIKNTKIIQIGLEKTKPYSRDWCYFYVGYLTAMHYALLRDDWDILLHVQDRTFLGEDITPILEKFMDRKETVLAPKYSSMIGCSIETGLIAFKREAVKKQVTQHFRIPLSTNNQVNVEEEAYALFWDAWWNPWPEISTIRQKDVIDNNASFKLDDNDFLNLPFIAAGNHADPDLVNKWIDIHPL